MPPGQWWLWLWLTRRYIWAWDWLRGGEVVFPSNTDWVKVVALGELTLWDRLMSWAADVVARLICAVHKEPGLRICREIKENIHNYNFRGAQPRTGCHPQEIRGNK